MSALQQSEIKLFVPLARKSLGLRALWFPSNIKTLSNVNFKKGGGGMFIAVRR